jgi:hypothetical protein
MPCVTQGVKVAVLNQIGLEIIGELERAFELNLTN